MISLKGGMVSWTDLVMTILMVPLSCVHGQNNTAACPSTPTDSNCASFVLQPINITASLDNLCNQMPGMPGCALGRRCESHPSIKTSLGKYCEPFSILATICADMPKMGGCAVYSRMCDPSNGGQGLSSQCIANPPLRNLPSSLIATRQIHSICTEMNMDGCDICKIPNAQATYSECDLIGTYSKLCVAMPGMKQCSQWSSLCAAANPDFTPNVALSNWCAGADQNPLAPPTMKMFFHTGTSDYVLFETWVPRTTLQYAGAIFGTIALGIAYECLLMLLALNEAKWSAEDLEHFKMLNQNDPRSGKMTDSKSPFIVAGIGGCAQGTKGITTSLIRGGFKFISVGFAYLLMLIAMTFNIGLFLSTLTGIAIGHVLFAPVAKAAHLKRAMIDTTDPEMDTSAECC